MQLATNVAGAALTVAALNLVEVADVPAGPGAVAIGIVPSFTALGAAQTATLQVIRNDTGVIIGSATITNSGAGASGAGPAVVIAPIPAGLGGAISLQVASSAAVGNAIGTATAPIVLLVLP